MTSLSPAQLTIVGGDATKPHCGKGHKIIAHICNDMGGWGRGFVMSLKGTFPKDNLDKSYRKWYKERNIARKQNAQQMGGSCGSGCAAGDFEGEIDKDVLDSKAVEGEHDDFKEEKISISNAACSNILEIEDSDHIIEEAATIDTAENQLKSIDEPFRLGSVQFLPIQSSSTYLTVANMVAQHGIKNSGRKGIVTDKVDYDALAEALEKVGRRAAADNNQCSVHMPKIGTGLAGGDWKRIEALIHTILVVKYGINVWVYERA